MNPMRSLRGIGDRLFDARLHDAHGGSITLFTEIAGAPAWLVRSDVMPGRLPEPPPGMRALCVGAAHHAVDAPWQSLVADAAWLATLASDCVHALDANLRVRSVHAHAPSAPRIPALDGVDLGMAPVLVVPGVFESDLCVELIEHLRVACGGGDASGVLLVEDGVATARTDLAIKQRRESPIRDGALEARVHERLLRRALPEISRTLQFDVQRRDPFKLLSYAAGAGYFRAHRDNDTPDVAHRRFALSVNLNPGEYVGGAFRYPEFGMREHAPALGAALVFSCSLLHEVTPVEQGTRYALTTFLA